MTREQAEQRALELYPSGTLPKEIEQERWSQRAAYLQCYDDMQGDMLTEADLVSFGNFLLSTKRYVSNNLVTHADLENWKELKTEK